MKTVQKLEILASAAILVASAIYICVSILPNVDLKNKELDSITFLFKVFLLIIFPSLLTAIGSYVHATKQSQVGFIAVLFGGIFLMLFFGLFFTLAVFYYHGWVNGWFAIIPIILVTITVILAFRSRKVFAPLA